MPAETRIPLRVIFHGSRGSFLAALLLAELAAAMQGIAYTTVLPVIANDLDGYALFGATLAAGTVSAVLMLGFSAPILARVRPGTVLLAATVLYVVGAAACVFAPTMVVVLIGSLVRGIAGGLMGGFGMGAIGGLFDERERPRVMGLFAFVWLLPSLVGPALNGVITEFAGWRWAIGWPAIAVVVARIFMGTAVRAIPWRRRHEPVRPVAGLVVTGCLALGAWGSAASGPWAIAAFAVGVAGAAAAIVVFLLRGAAAARVLITFAILCAAFFGAYELLSLAVIEGFSFTVVWAAGVLMAGLIAWSIAGLRPRPDARPDRVIVGIALAVVATVALAATVATASGLVAIALSVSAAGLAGWGMGLAYPLLSTEPFALSASASTAGALIAFAETAGTAWAALLGGGLYSALHTAGWMPRPSLALVYSVFALTGVAGLLLALRRRRGHVPPHRADLADSLPDVDAQGRGEVGGEQLDLPRREGGTAQPGG